MLFDHGILSILLVGYIKPLEVTSIPRSFISTSNNGRRAEVWHRGQRLNQQ